MCGMNRNHTSQGSDPEPGTSLGPDSKQSMQTGTEATPCTASPWVTHCEVELTRHHLQTQKQEVSLGSHGECPGGGPAPNPQVWGQKGLRLQGGQHLPGDTASFFPCSSHHSLSSSNTNLVSKAPDETVLLSLEGPDNKNSS